MTVFMVYTYPGAGTIIQVAHPAVWGGLTLTYRANGDYAGWDRFGRATSERRTNTARTTDLDRFPSNDSWQVLEERADGMPSGQYLWDIRYIDAPVLRWRDADANPATGLEETLYYASDANMNVTVLVDASTGTVQERYMYDPYGQATVLDANWGLDADGLSDVANNILYCGYGLDAETGLYPSRLRSGYHPTLGVWVQRDPACYVDGMNLYQYVGSEPTNRADPQGLWRIPFLPRPGHPARPWIQAPVPETKWIREDHKEKAGTERYIYHKTVMPGRCSAANEGERAEMITIVNQRETIVTTPASGGLYRAVLQTETRTVYGDVVYSKVVCTCICDEKHGDAKHGGSVIPDKSYAWVPQSSTTTPNQVISIDVTAYELWYDYHLRTVNPWDLESPVYAEA